MELTEITYRGPDITDQDIFGKLSEDYQNLLRQANGFIAFAGGLHVRGACLTPEWHSIRKVWLGDFALYKLYSSLNQTDAPFAQDCVGDQFILREGMVHRLRAETGELHDLQMDLQTFMRSAQDDPVEFLSLYPLLQFQNEGGELEPGQLLSVYPPFCTKESKNGVSLKAVPVFDRLEFLAYFSRQIGG